MGKLSTLGSETTFNLSDFLVKVKAAGAGDVLVTLQNFINAIGAAPSNPYKFNVYRDATAYSAANGAITKLPLNAKRLDTSNNFDATTNFRFTTPINGFYFFTGKINFGASTTRGLASIGINGSDSYRGTDNTQGAGEMSSVVAAFVQLSANDTVELDYYTTPGGNLLNPGSGTYFMGHLVCVT